MITLAFFLIGVALGAILGAGGMWPFLFTAFVRQTTHDWRAH